jgi:dienelactone hydrolase
MGDLAAKVRAVAAATIAGLLAIQALGQADHAPPIPIQHALVIDSVGQYGRAPVHRDAVQALLAAGRWQPPMSGQSITLPDGTVHTWEPLAANDLGALAHAFLRGGYASAVIESDSERVMILEASGHNMVYVNGEPRAGDPYSYGFVHLPILLLPGSNELLFHGGRSGQIHARLVSPRAEAMISPPDMTLPDLVVGKSRDAIGAVVIINASERSMDDLSLRASLVESENVLARAETALGLLPPLSVRKLPFTLPAIEAAAPGEARFALELLRRIPDPDELIVIDSLEFTARIRGPGETIKRTFTSDIDGSVQYFAHRPPAPTDSLNGPDSSRPALILTLHGASVEATSQADAYAPRDWAHIVAPTNRRPFGFDWEDWGRLDAMEVLAFAQQELEVNPRRIYLTGHSMGGHGTWHLGVTFPDRFAAIAPSAGWASFWTYTGAASFDDTNPIEAVLHRATRSSDTLALAENLAGLGIYVLHGEADDNVPPGQARTMLAALAGFHADFTYHQQPGAAHWWDDQATAGADCVDWPPLMAFLQERSRPAQSDLHRIRFATFNPGVSATRDWVTIESQLSPLTISRVDLQRDPNENLISGTTENVERLTINLSPLELEPPITIILDGDVIHPSDQDRPPDRVHLRRGAEGWSSVAAAPPALKGPHRNGLFKDAFRHRVVFVHATRGSDAENAWAFAKARFDAETFWYRGNGSFDVIADTDFNPALEPDRNVVLYGNADTNAAWSALLGDSPIQTSRAGVSIDGRALPGDNLGAIFIRPRPGSDIASVGAVSGSSVLGCRLTDRLPWFVSGVAYPDFLVVGPETFSDGIAGIRAAGIFANDWTIDPKHRVLSSEF